MFLFSLQVNVNMNPMSIAYKQSEEDDIQKFQLDRITEPAWNPELETLKHESMFLFFLLNVTITPISISWMQTVRGI